MSDYFDRVERQLVGKVEAGVPRRSRCPIRLGHLAVAASLLVVIAVGAVFLSVRGSSGTSSTGSSAGSSARSHAIRVVLGAPRASMNPSIGPSVAILRRRLNSVFHGVRVSRAGSNIVVVVHKGAGVSRGQIVALAISARLVFYDWEADALTPNGKTVASQLQAQDRTALTISQGTATTSPGSPGAGSMALYQAVTLASRQPAAALRPTLERLGPEYYMFGAPGSAACAAAAKFNQTPPVQGKHCLLSGPDISVANLDSGLPPGVSASAGQVLTVPQGTVVLQAANPSASDQVKPTSASAQFFVLKDNLSIIGNAITNPRQSTDQSGSPDVTFGFTSKGQTEFTQVTKQIAHRGENSGFGGLVLDQHFAVALDQQLITVPSIDYKVYPDGVTGVRRADISGAFTTRSAQTLATLLRYGPLPVSLTAH